MRTETISHNLEYFPFRISISATVSQPMIFTDYHLHHEIELTKVLSGKMKFSINDVSICCNTGDIIIINSNTPHSSESIEKNTQQLLFQSESSLVNISDLNDINHPYLQSFIVSDVKPYYLIPNQTKLNTELTVYLQNLHKEVTQKNHTFETYIKGYLTLLSASFNRNKILTDNLETQKNHNINKIFPIVEYIDQNYSSVISLKDISTATHLNEYYMCRLFKSATRQTIFNYINHVRIAKAENLLTQTDLGITEIALCLGFANPSRLNETFKKVTGTTPSKYRQHSYSVKL